MSFLPLLIVFTGAYLLFRLRFFFLLHPFLTLKTLIKALSTRTSRRNLALSLAGTLGVGNIVGVALGISIGGSGAVFWLLISSLFSITIKYCESSLSADLSGGWGMVGTFRVLFFKYGKYLSSLYAISIIILSFTLGSSIQVSAIISCSENFKLNSLVCVLIVSVILLYIIINGRERIKGITAYLISIASIAYIALCVYVIVIKLDKVPSVISDICNNAFLPRSAVGGALGFLSNNALREGFSRGLMSNEAGTGTSSLANSEGVRMPHYAGLIGIVEVFFDTVVICTLSSIAILVSFEGDFANTGGMEIVLSSLGRSFFGIGEYVLLFSVTLFAMSSIICWYYYGVKCVVFLGFKHIWIYSILFICSFYLSLVLDEITLVRISDFFLFVLTLLTSFVLIKSSDRIKRLSELGGLIKNFRD